MAQFLKHLFQNVWTLMLLLKLFDGTNGHVFVNNKNGLFWTDKISLWYFCYWLWNFTNDWSWTVDFWFWQQPLCQPCHNQTTTKPVPKLLIASWWHFALKLKAHSHSMHLMHGAAENSCVAAEKGKFVISHTTTVCRSSFLTAVWMSLK